jgi:hypothetical protein
MIVNATTTGNAAFSPDAAIDSLRTKLNAPMWDDWEVVEPVTVSDFGSEFEATVKLWRKLDTPLKLCPHGADPKDCPTCTRF